MPFYDDRPFGEIKESTTQERLRLERERTGPVFSAQGSFNPTNMAVENSLKEIFDEFHTMITGELMTYNKKEDDEPLF